MVPVKVCGLTREQDAALAWELGAAALGFVFHSPSPRGLTVRRAAQLTRALPQEAFCVGVFVDVVPEEVNAVCAEAGLSAAQLHGGETPEACAAVTVPVIKALRAEELADPGRVDAYRVAVFLLDAHVPGRTGGTGHLADWDAARRLARKVPLVLAGGLNPANAREAWESVKPAALDLGSGVESAPGIKDPKKIRALFAALAGASSEVTGGRPCLIPQP